MKKITKKDIIRIQGELKKAEETFSATGENKDLKRIYFLKATLNRYSK